MWERTKVCCLSKTFFSPKPSSKKKKMADDNDIPHRFLCPITHEVMQDPVSDGNGNFFERTAIVTWVSQHGSCPLTRRMMKVTELVEAKELKKEIEDFMRGKGEEGVVCSDSKGKEKVNDGFPVEVPVFLCSVAHGRQLSCTDKETIKTIPNKLSWEEWSIEKSGNEVFLSSIKHDRRLMCSPKGDLSGCKNRKGWEKWRMIDAGEGYWFLESNHHRGKFLSSDKEGNVFTTGNKLGWEKWAIEKSSMIFGVPIMLRSVKHKRQLSCTDAATIKTFPNKLSWEEWIIEKSGNEVFLSSIAHDQRLMCSPKGYLSGCKNRKGWEKWRMIDAGEGYWFLESNQHRGKFLSSDKDGNVLTTGNKRGWEKWAIERSPLIFNVPVFLSSVQHRRQLSCTDAATLITTHNKKSWEKWVIEKSGNEVFLSSIKHDQRLMCSPKGYLSGCKNRKSWEKWRMIDAGEGYWFLESNQHRGKFLSSDKDGNVLTTGNKRGWEKWAIQRI